MDKMLEFKAYCFTAYQHSYGLKGKELVTLFDAHGVWDYLKAGYGVLHTLSLDYIVKEIDLFIKAKHK